MTSDIEYIGTSLSTPLNSLITSRQPSGWTCPLAPPLGWISESGAGGDHNVVVEPIVIHAILGRAADLVED